MPQRRLRNLAITEVSAFPKNIELLLRCHFSGNVAALSRFLCVHRFTILAWKSGAHSPTLLSLADLSLKVAVTLTDLLGRELTAADFTLLTDPAGQLGQRRFVSPPRVDLERMRQVLEEALKDGVVPNPSLNQLATQLGCNQSTLQRRFPELARRVKERYQEFYAIKKEVRANLFRSMVRRTVMDLHKAGFYPSQSRVRQALPEFIDMREPVAQDKWKRKLGELEQIL